MTTIARQKSTLIHARDAHARHAHARDAHARDAHASLSKDVPPPAHIHPEILHASLATPKFPTPGNRDSQNSAKVRKIYQIACLCA
jgi:hypothetical protein